MQTRSSLAARSLSLATLLALGAGALGCAQGAVVVGDSGSGVVNDGGAVRDATTHDAPSSDAAMSTRDGGGTTPRDGGAPSCPSGQHACGAGCVADLANDPANGCRLGCGEPCDAPDAGAASCDTAGRCTWTCEPPFRREGDLCVCTPTTCSALSYECGAPDDGCGTPLNCGSCMVGAACTTGRCACMPDGFEPNDTRATATPRARLSDADDPPDVVLNANIDDARDEDWFAFPITDGFDSGNPRITVTLSDIPVGSDYTLSAYYVCDSGTDASTCAAGSSDNFLGRGCTGNVAGSGPETVEIETDCEHVSIDDDGQLFVRIRAATWMNTCSNYRVVVRVR